VTKAAEDFIIRRIEEKDNPELAFVVRTTLAEFGANKPGTVFFDPTTDELFNLFQKTGSVYYVALKDDKVVGGGGIYPTVGFANRYLRACKNVFIARSQGNWVG
jgi:putative acetyltransferase